MNEPGQSVLHDVILVQGPSGPRAVIVDGACALEISAREWRWIGGRVLSIGEGDDFSITVDLAELVTGVAGARAADPRSVDYRAEVLDVREWPGGDEPA